MSNLPSGSTKTHQKHPINNLLNRDRISALIFLVFCLSYGYQTSQIPLFPSDDYEPFTARTLPTLLTYVGIILSLLLLATAKQSNHTVSKGKFNYKLLLGFLILMALYGIGLTYVGFVIATGIFLLTGFYLLGERRKQLLLGASFPFAIAFYLLLTQGLDIYLEPGVIFSMMS
ncbi:tripartite tricarboxylate transporter TctB family protein [Vibrio pectenicida]|uniref:Tripartite tricarboxylate transporter TctB family protein n=1 Tax=Vibrio pectenicida TaxID=62763 RepID=A0A3R9EDH3_9VIBR|nr:tripartite tricarboxylate transporter TctB family protein [Vibrio pectenicida]RSD31447.1 tripartite tricarboxylate transporter TctB family protein [Vibrio pectenicida]